MSSSCRRSAPPLYTPLQGQRFNPTTSDKESAIAPLSHSSVIRRSALPILNLPKSKLSHAPTETHEGNSGPLVVGVRLKDEWVGQPSNSTYTAATLRNRNDRPSRTGSLQSPQAEEGNECLPVYSKDILLRAILPHKVEFGSPEVHRNSLEQAKLLIGESAKLPWSTPSGHGGTATIAGAAGSTTAEERLRQEQEKIDGGRRPGIDHLHDRWSRPVDIFQAPKSHQRPQSEFL
ncbi:hypothetical protein C8R41DRAFT_923140 [Lentinula lateritia]|uniref:Uncharacterized protein n=1 Tax=Lentinula lateritia TaxID=40482 RepID=A0ABQ8V7B0_9AGAR|nr:hypothetical protein C8R41DRAFT_923140 [Lentinula lateritia]